jgi:hypothetical protein
MLLCDWCEQGCHLACHDPPLAGVPEVDEWFCPRCRHIASHHQEALHLRDQFRNCLEHSGISDENMLDATAALLEGEAANPADADKDALAAVHVAGTEATEADKGASKEVCLLQASCGERQGTSIARQVSN